MRFYCYILFLIFLPTMVSAGEFPYDRYRFQHTFPPLNKQLKLPRRFLIPNSETVSIGGLTLMREIDYEINCIDGLIGLKNLPEDSVIVQYEIFPWSLNRYYYHRLMPEPERIPLIKPEVSVSESIISPADESPFSFNRSGTIFRSITVGSNRDASLESGMDLKLNGRIGKGTTVTAALSDQNIPIQPEGDTRTLEEIDKVYVSVKSDNYTLNLGDYNLAVEGREFASIDRKLTGAQGNISGDKFNLMLSGAASKGEFRSESFTGIEGLQGPYQLRGKRGETGILILAGTEKVWVNGVLMTRGDNYDYIIDYSKGELTFTEAAPVTVDTRIIVDFQYASGDYSRNLYHTAGELELFSDKLKLSYVIGHESDAKGNPLAVALTDDAKSALKSAGDDPYSAVNDGAEYVGEGEGDYIKTFDPDSTVIYVWAGSDSGDYDVIFSYIGYLLGSYQRQFSPQGDIYYEYVGGALGDYEPVILLPLPRREELADFTISYQPHRNIKAELEAAASRFDRNTFSAINDGDNDGFALSGKLSADSLKIPALIAEDVSAGFSLKTKNVNENFHRLDRTEEAEYNRKWGYTDTLSLREESYDFSGYLIPFKGWNLTGGFGALKKDDFNSGRWDAGLTYRQAEETYAHIFMEDIRTKSNGISGFWRRANSEMRHWLGIFQPGMHFEAEDQSQAGEGLRFCQYRPALKIGRENGLSAEYTRRIDETRTGSELFPLSILNRAHLLYQNRSRHYDLILDYTHSDRNYQQPDSTDIVSDLGRIEYNTRSADGAVIFSLQHRITQSRTAQTALIPIEVAWGEGNYVKVGDQYFPDLNGNYLLISQDTGEFSRSAKVKSSFNLRLDPRRSRNADYIPPILKLFYTETYFSIDEESGMEDPWRLYVLYLPVFRGDSTLYGAQTARQDIHYRKGNRDFSLRFRITDNRSLNNRLISAPERLVRDEYSLRVWKALSETISLQSMASYSRENRWLADIPSRDMTFYSTDNLIHHQLSRPLELRIGIKYEYSYDEVDDISARSITVNPQLDYSIFGRGRMTAGASWIGVFSDSEYIPYEMTLGNGKGSNYIWSLRMAYRIGKNLNLTADYNGESKVDRPVIHTGRMEIRAFF